MSTPRQSFVLTLRDTPGFLVPAEVRLRRVLKSLIRTYGFRCTELRPATGPIENTSLKDSQTEIERRHSGPLSN